MKNIYTVFLSFVFCSFLVKAGYFDPHNHINGVLKPKDYANLQKVIAGEEPTTAELHALWQSLVSLYSNKAYLADPRNSNGTLNTLACNEPASSEHREDFRQVLLRNLDKILSATPVTAFDSAYANRGRVEDNFIFKGLTKEEVTKAKKDMMRAILYRLGEDNIDLVEMSTNFIGGDKGVRIKNMLAYNEMIKDLLSEETSEENMPLKRALTEQNFPIPRIAWLLMTHTSELGRTGKSEGLTYLDFRNGECAFEPFVNAMATDPKKHLYEALVKNEEIVGTDTAGVETTCFTSDGMERFKQIAQTVYEASKAKRQQTGKMRKMVVHVHVGEGSPVLNLPITKSKDAACFSVRKPPRVKFNAKLTAPLHFSESRKNVGVLLEAISQLKKTIPDIDDFVIFRMGHAASINNEQAKLAKELNVEADVNLSSNIATGSWTVDRKIYNAYLAFDPELPTRLLESVLKSKVANVKHLLGDHGLKWLLLHDVVTILGTDGSGLEHAYMPREYEMAEELINYWNDTDPIFKSRNITIKRLLDNENYHRENMGYDKSMDQ